MRSFTAASKLASGIDTTCLPRFSVVTDAGVGAGHGGGGLEPGGAGSGSGSGSIGSGPGSVGASGSVGSGSGSVGSGPGSAGVSGTIGPGSGSTGGGTSILAWSAGPPVQPTVTSITRIARMILEEILFPILSEALGELSFGVFFIRLSELYLIF